MRTLLYILETNALNVYRLLLYDKSIIKNYTFTVITNSKSYLYNFIINCIRKVNLCINKIVKKTRETYDIEDDGHV